MGNNFRATVSSGWTLAWRNIRMQVREHLLGYAWVLLIPMMYAVCYVFIKRELMGNASLEGAEAGWDTLRAFTGITLFQFWIQLVQGMSELVRKQKGMLRGLNIGATPFVLAIVFESALALLIRSLLIIIAIPLLGLSFPQSIISWVLFIGSLFALQLTAISIGLILLPWSALYADVRKALSSITLPMLLISPVFYPAVKDTNSWLYWVNCFNPVASPLAVLADAFQTGTYGLYLMPMMIWSALALLLICWSLLKLRRQVPILLERVGN